MNIQVVETTSSRVKNVKTDITVKKYVAVEEPWHSEMAKSFY